MSALACTVSARAIDWSSALFATATMDGKGDWHSVFHSEAGSAGLPLPSKFLVSSPICFRTPSVLAFASVAAVTSSAVTPGAASNSPMPAQPEAIVPSHCATDRFCASSSGLLLLTLDRRDEQWIP
ncbi:hypothetical protein ACVW1A_002136 [Bradyrhizobium sp. LB1.3]